MTISFPRPRILLAAALAGAIAGCTIVACLVVLGTLVLHSPITLAGFFAFDASALVGKVAYTSSAYVALGCGLHFAVAIGWALGYAYVAQRQRELITQPLLSGAVFGIIVYFAMQLVLVAANLYHTPTPGELGIALLAHLVFYGIPIAVIVGRIQRSA